MTQLKTTVTGERADLLEALNQHRYFLRCTTEDLTDEQAARCTTASELTLGGLVKHVTAVERQWSDFLAGDSAAISFSEEAMRRHEEGFRMREETLAVLLAEYERVARRTDELMASLPDLDVTQPLPDAPWYEPGTRWSARRVLLHLIAETAQHAGHADIIRESIDGAKTMG